MQGLALVQHIGLGALHQIGNQVVAALELHINLRKSILKLVAQRHQLVVSHQTPAEHSGGNEDCKNTAERHDFSL